MAVAGLGEITNALKGGVSKYTGEILNTFMSAIDDSSVEVCSNSIYGLGLLLESAPQDLTRHHLTHFFSNFSQYNSILVKLQRFFTDDAPQNARDNAVGCVSRMILRHSQVIPLDLVIPLSSII
jgi:importin-4